MPPEYVGGLGEAGAAAVSRFVEAGGWLLAIDEAADFAIERLGLPVRNVVAELESAEFFIPGSLIRLEVDAGDPLAYGMAEDAIAMFARSQVFELDDARAAAGTRPAEAVPAELADAAAGPAKGAGSAADVEAAPDVYVRYAAQAPLASGWALGAERFLAGRAAAVRVPVGRGQAVLIGFAPHKRGQPHNTFKLLFDPLYAAADAGLEAAR